MLRVFEHAPPGSSDDSGLDVGLSYADAVYRAGHVLRALGLPQDPLLVGPASRFGEPLFAPQSSDGSSTPRPQELWGGTDNIVAYEIYGVTGPVTNPPNYSTMDRVGFCVTYGPAHGESGVVPAVTGNMGMPARS